MAVQQRGVRFTVGFAAVLVAATAGLPSRGSAATLSDEGAAAAFAKAESLFQRDDFAGAAAAFREALQRYPDSTRAGAARLQLGKSLWRLAAVDSRAVDDKAATADERKRRKAKLDENLRAAAEQFGAVESELRAQEQSRRPLKDDEAGRLRVAAFGVAECDFFLGHYTEAERQYEKLADRYKGRVDELVALSQLWQCANLGKNSDLRDSAIDRLRDALKSIPDERYDFSTPIHRRAFWENWLKTAAK
jgi:tetratricopeptide (TPR) repeat protein